MRPSAAFRCWNEGITIGGHSPVVTSDVVFIRPIPGLGRVVMIGNKAPAVTPAETRSSPGPARIITVGDKSPVVMAQATATRPIPGPRPEEFQAKRRKLTSCTVSSELVFFTYLYPYAHLR